MSYLDPVLAEARDIRGVQRFYPHGKHPATHQLTRQLSEIERLREQTVAAQRAYRETHVCFQEDETMERYRRALGDADEAIRYLRRELALFEEGESIAKATYLRTVER